ncbi:MAG TPA: GNAT family N-acetyltransferase [Rhizomicrobium sp.]|nr:GNAT family N-acetyltransferase [Rhizomicrobium sp.]
MPKFILESERLILRPPEPADAPEIARQMNDWQVARNLSRAPFPYTEAHAREFIARQEEGRASATDFAFAVLLKKGGALVGACGAHLRENGFEIGYWIGRAHWGLGYATEAAGEVAAFAFRNLRVERLEAGWFFDNPASGRVLEKLGFRPAGSAERDCAARGCKVLCRQVAMTRAEFGQRVAA